MQHTNLTRKNVAAGRRLRPLRHTRQYAEPETDNNTSNEEEDSEINVYLKHVSLKEKNSNNDNDNNHARSLHNALESLKGRVHHARGESAKRSHSKNQTTNIHNINSEAVSTKSKVSKQFLSASMPIQHKRQFCNNNNGNNTKDFSSSTNINDENKRMSSASRHHDGYDDCNTHVVAKVHNAWENKVSDDSMNKGKKPEHTEVTTTITTTTTLLLPSTESLEPKNTLINKNNNKRTKPTIAILQKRNSVQEPFHHHNKKKIITTRTAVEAATSDIRHKTTRKHTKETQEKQNTKCNENVEECVRSNNFVNDVSWEESEKEKELILPFAPHDMDVSFYNNKENWQIDLSRDVCVLLEGEMLEPPFSTMLWQQVSNETEATHQQQQQQQQQFLQIELDKEEQTWESHKEVQSKQHKAEKEKANDETKVKKNLTNMHNYKTKLTNGFFACICCQVPICAPEHQIKIPETLQLWESHKINNAQRSGLAAFACINHKAVTLSLNTTSTSSTNRNTNNNNMSNAQTKCNEQLHIMVHCIYCNGCLGELSSFSNGREAEWEVAELTYVYLANSFCLQYMPFRTHYELDTPVDLVLCLEQEEEDTQNNIKHEGNNDSAKMVGLTAHDEDLFEFDSYNSDYGNEISDSEDEYK